MPTTIRFLTVLIILAAIAYGVMLGLVTFVEPTPGEMEIRIPAERLNTKKG